MGVLKKDAVDCGRGNNSSFPIMHNGSNNFLSAIYILTELLNFTLSNRRVLTRVYNLLIFNYCQVPPKDCSSLVKVNNFAEAVGEPE